MHALVPYLHFSVSFDFMFDAKTWTKLAFCTCAIHQLDVSNDPRRRMSNFNRESSTRVVENVCFFFVVRAASNTETH